MTADPTRILLLEPDAHVREQLSAALVRHGFRVLTAGDGAAAVERARAGGVDAVVLDLGSAHERGGDVLGELRELDASLPVVVLARREDVAAAQRATEAGAFAFLVKTLHEDALAVLLRRAVESRALDRELTALRRRLRDAIGTTPAANALAGSEAGPLPSLREIAVAAVEAAERAAIVAMLDATSGNKSEAARRLRTDYKTLHVKISRYGLREPRSA